MDTELLRAWEKEAKVAAARIRQLLDERAPSDLDPLPDVSDAEKNGSNSAHEAYLAYLNAGKHLDEQFLAHAYRDELSD